MSGTATTFLRHAIRFGRRAAARAVRLFARPARVAPLERQDPPRRPQRLLLVAWFDPKGLSTIAENIASIGRLSRFSFDLLNLYRRPFGPMAIPAAVRLDDYAGLFIHCTASYDPANLLALDAHRREKIADYRGLKIMMKQDEHYRTNRVIDYLARQRFDLLLTCMPPCSVGQVYGDPRLARLRFLHTLTGYVSDRMRQFRLSQRDERPIDVGYRGSLQPFHFGRLCYEKQSIGYAFSEFCRRRGLAFDISSRWEDRFLDESWFGFLGRCKGILGTESGASIFDFDGSVETAATDYLRRHPDAPFEEVWQAVLAPVEGNVYYNQVSPRHFEAAATRTVQLLYEGQYSGIFQKDRHYLSIRRDHADADEALSRLMDPAERLRLSEAAFEEIIMNDRWHYATFIKELDDAIEALLDRR
ncbi:MAG: glycosyltransferase [Planctomycetaceae bacterium]|nr:glycosyltransferase [Planctomycetaceae bacterium]